MTASVEGVMSRPSFLPRDKSIRMAYDRPYYEGPPMPMYHGGYPARDYYPAAPYPGAVMPPVAPAMALAPYSYSFDAETVDLARRVWVSVGRDYEAMRQLMDRVATEDVGPRERAAPQRPARPSPGPARDSETAATSDKGGDKPPKTEGEGARERSAEPDEKKRKSEEKDGAMGDGEPAAKRARSDFDELVAAANMVSDKPGADKARAKQEKDRANSPASSPRTADREPDASFHRRIPPLHAMPPTIAYAGYGPPLMAHPPGFGPYGPPAPYGMPYHVGPHGLPPMPSYALEGARSQALSLSQSGASVASAKTVEQDREQELDINPSLLKVLTISPTCTVRLVPPTAEVPGGMSFFGYVNGYNEAVHIFTAVRSGTCRIVHGRLTETERNLIRAGQGYVYDELTSGIKRWTDGYDWKDSYWQYNKKAMLYKEAEYGTVDNKRVKVEKPNGLRKKVIADPASTMRLVCYYRGK